MNLNPNRKNRSCSNTAQSLAPSPMPVPEIRLIDAERSHLATMTQVEGSSHRCTSMPITYCGSPPDLMLFTPFPYYVPSMKNETDTSRMISWTFLLPAELLAVVREAADADGRSVSGWMRRALMEKLARAH